MSPNPPSPLRFGIIGFGRFAEQAIAPAIRSASNARLVAIQKRSQSAVEERARALNIPLAFTSANDLVAHPEVDAVFIVSANVAHAAETIAAARAGKHVLVEKPIAMNASEAEEMIEECRKAGVTLMVGHMVRLSPAVRRMKELMQTGTIGRVTFVKSEFTYDARLSQRGWLFDRVVAGGGPLYDIAVHCLDTIRFILDDEVASVKAHLSPVPSATETEATAHLALRFTRGTTASIYTSFESGIRRSALEVVGTEGMLALEHFTRSDMTLELLITRAENGMPGTMTRETIVVPNLYRQEVELFAESVLRGTPSPIPGEEGLRNQRILDAAVRSASQAD